MTIQLIKQIGHFRVVRQHRQLRSPPRGLRQTWTEYQVRDGKKVLSRHDGVFAAIQDAERRLEEHWDAIAQKSHELWGN